MEMTINSAAAAEMKPAQRYLDATAKHAGTASIASDGAIENYIAGRPFDPAEFTQQLTVRKWFGGTTATK